MGIWAVKEQNSFTNNIGKQLLGYFLITSVVCLTLNYTWLPGAIIGIALLGCSGMLFPVTLNIMRSSELRSI